MSIAFPAANERAPMFRVSLILEMLRARPALMFWVAALSQGALWTLVPSLFYAAPPGEVPLVLAVGKEWPLGSPYGPPLAAWAANLAFEIAGRSIVGVYRALAGLRGRDLLGGVRARPPHARLGARRDGDPADGRHQRVHGADARVRPDGAGDAADRGGAAVLLSRARRQPASRLGALRCRARAADPHDLYRAHPARADRAVHGRDRARAQPACSASARSPRC